MTTEFTVSQPATNPAGGKAPKGQGRKNAAKGGKGGKGGKGKSTKGKGSSRGR